MVACTCNVSVEMAVLVGCCYLEKGGKIFDLVVSHPLFIFYAQTNQSTGTLKLSLLCTSAL